MPHSTQHPFRYRFERGANGKQSHTFYAPDQATADRYAARWGKRMGFERVIRRKVKAKG